LKSGIRDNRARGNVADFLREKVASGSHQSLVSAYFTIYAYDALAKELDQVQSVKFLFGEAKFIQTSAMVWMRRPWLPQSSAPATPYTASCLSCKR